MTRLAQVLLVLGVLGACALCAPAQAAGGDLREKLPRYLQSIALVLTDSGTGTAFAVESSPSGTLLITSSHVVQGAASVRLRSGEAPPVVARVVADDPRTDLALLQASGLNLTPLPLAPAEPALGTELAVVGYPLVDRLKAVGMGVQPSVSKGVLSAVSQRDGTSVLQVDVPVNPGNSGGPAFDWETGQVVGVVTARLRDASDINFLVGTTSLHAFLAQRPTPGPAATPIADLLDQSGIKYEINERGNFVVLRGFQDERTQLVFIYGKAWDYQGVQVRELFSPAFRLEGELPADLANQLLTRSQETSVGGWQVIESGGERIVAYAIKVVDRMTAEELRTWIDCVASEADDLEEKVTAKDDF